MDGGRDPYWGLARKVSEINRRNTGSLDVPGSQKQDSFDGGQSLPELFRAAPTRLYIRLCMHFQFTSQDWAEPSVGGETQFGISTQP